ncbi:DJ-1/PfpI family protein [Actinocrinis sp.]|uniref:DJ-1/PfpI family protein n=1 Tax=Actinocrinis sp. TaxID=1920516 RepID=UPI002CA97E5D|nr:DJ-1/PfpI family protein [Actinocrinis sp.]HXR72570.1 DJ-1/PfpI family protein [Actinocrinis sp.]
MSDIALREDGPLAGARVVILMESDYVEPEISYYQHRFAEEGVAVDLATRLWGQRALTFTGHEYQAPITVEGDLEALDYTALSKYDALIVPGGMVADRLRYSEKPGRLAPAAELLRRAFALPRLVKGLNCHALWLAAPVPQTVRGRKLTCHNNLYSDARNMGADYVDADVVTDGDLVTARSADLCHLFARRLLDAIASHRGAAPSGERR